MMKKLTLRFIKSVLGYYGDTIDSMSPYRFMLHLKQEGMPHDMVMTYLMASLVPALSETDRKRVFDHTYSSIPRTEYDVVIINSSEMGYKSLRGLINKLPDKTTFIIFGSNPTNMYNLDVYMDTRNVLRISHEPNWAQVKRYIKQHHDKLDLANSAQDIMELTKIHNDSRRTRNNLIKLLQGKSAQLFIKMPRTLEWRLVSDPSDMGNITKYQLYKTQYLPHLNTPRPTYAYYWENKHKPKGAIVWRTGWNFVDCVPHEKCLKNMYTSPHCNDCIKGYNKDRPKSRTVLLKKKPTAYQLEQYYYKNPLGRVKLLERKDIIIRTDWFMLQPYDCLPIHPDLLYITDEQGKKYPTELSELYDASWQSGDINFKQVKRFVKAEELIINEITQEIVGPPGSVELITKKKVTYQEPRELLLVEDLEPAEGMPHGLGFEATLMDLENNGLIVNPGMTIFTDDKITDAAHNCVVYGNMETFQQMTTLVYTPEPSILSDEEAIAREVAEEYKEHITEHDDSRNSRIIERFLRDPRIKEIINKRK